jgi:hypothetical protein
MAVDTEVVLAGGGERVEIIYPSPHVLVTRYLNNHHSLAITSSEAS